MRSIRAIATFSSVAVLAFSIVALSWVGLALLGYQLPRLLRFCVACPASVSRPDRVARMTAQNFAETCLVVARSPLYPTIPRIGPTRKLSMHWSAGTTTVSRVRRKGYRASWPWKGHQLCGCAWPIFMPCFIRLPLQPASSRARATIAKKRICCPTSTKMKNLKTRCCGDLTQRAKPAREGLGNFLQSLQAFGDDF
jgi:hypothetical protein